MEIESNQDLAIRIKGIAETMMHFGDFVAARNFALRAQKLHANLENISEMLMVCEVHCVSEQKLIGGEMDWCGILQVEETADDAAIEQQYMKFASVLHPETNTYPGAEAAFKIIKQAKTVLLSKCERSSPHCEDIEAYWRLVGMDCNKDEAIKTKGMAKRKRKHYESSSSNSDENVPMDDGDSKVKVDAHGSADCVRRSARSKEQVPYKENLHDNDGVYLDILSDDDGVEEVQDNSKKLKGSDVSSVSQVSRLKKKSPVKTCGMAANTTVLEEADNKVTSDNEQDFKTDGASSSCSDSEHTQRQEFFVCPDSEFHDFDSQRSESCFSQGQIWALYDEVDAMPRFYARIQKVFSPGFKLNIRWLEHCPDEKDERDWVCDDFSPAYGEFKLGKTLKVESCDFFCHLVLKKSGRVSTYKIFPRKGEVWALFRNWQAIWKSGPVANRIDYEFAEILSDFSEDEGACVAFLDKMEGFVSLFCQTKKENMYNVQIPPKELFRFSHMVPYSTMTGEEREGVPRESLELDTAALPTTCQ